MLSVNASIVISILQILGDIFCACASARCALKNEKKYRLFFIFNTIAFLGIGIGDFYYDYFFRFLKQDVSGSLNVVITVSLLTFQLSQSYNWISINKIHKIGIFAKDNISYLMFTIVLISILVYYFINSNMSMEDTWYQIFNITLNMTVWTLAIICLSRSRTVGFTLLALGCLLITSAALTTDCLFMFEMHKLESATSIHMIWALGVLVMACGFYLSIGKKFDFCPHRSVQAKCCSWLSITSLSFILILFFLVKFLDHEISFHIGSLLWSMPIFLVLSMILSVLSGNWFSNIILFPVNNFIRDIQHFDEHKLETNQNSPQILNAAYQLYEFNVLNSFLNNAFSKIKGQLDYELKLSAQIAHDLRSPLMALESKIQNLPIKDEKQKTELRYMMNHVRDITNNLEKNNTVNQKEYLMNTQVTHLLEYVISERNAAYLNEKIQIKNEFDPLCYNFFIEVIPSEMKRVLTNIINNAHQSVETIQNPIIDVSLARENNNIVIIVSDNGLGIQVKNISKVFNHGFTTKKNGSGLGLYHAKETLKKWDGNIELMNNDWGGCSAKISLPAKEIPSWFVRELSIYKNSTLICVDDSMLIWQAWKDRLSVLQTKIPLEYCASKNQLVRFLENDFSSECVFLVDYEFSGKSYTGLDLIDIIQYSARSNHKIFLVTSHSNEETIQKSCMEKGIYLIPKNYVFKMPIHILEITNENTQASHLQPLFDNGIKL